MRRDVSTPLFAGAAVASIGGPLALIVLVFPGDALASPGKMFALALLVFLAPLAVWLGFSERIASAGGLAAFVDAAAGPWAARFQALVWSVSYFLYLPYTITYVVYDVLAPVFPGLVPYRASLELLLPVGIVVLALAPLALNLAVLTVAAGAQLVLLAALGGVVYAHTGAPRSSFTQHVGAAPLGRGVAATALLFICLSLPLFFGAEVRDGSRTIRRGLVAAYVIVGAFGLFAAIPLASAAGRLGSTDLPFGVAIAQTFSGRGFADAIAIGAAVSTTGLILLELLALGRLAHWLFRTPIRPTIAAVGVPFVVADALSLIDPESFYNDLIRPSLVALFLSQLIVFVVFPLFRLRTEPRRLPAALATAAVASALAGYGLYTALTGSLGS